MADLLSQNEIDKLLSALSSGEINLDELPKGDENQKLKVYYFNNPKRFSKEIIRTLEFVHDNYVRIVTNFLSSHLRTNVKITVQSINQTTYEEFIHSIPNPTILMIFKMPPLNGSLLFETNPQFVFQVIDFLLGGTGSSKFRVKEFTEIDKNIIYEINKGLIESLKLAWKDVLNVDTEVEGLETNPIYNQTLPPKEPVALITFSVAIGRNSSFINICLPYLSIEKLQSKLVIQYKKMDEDKEIIRESKDAIKNKLNSVDVGMTALLGKTSITVDDFLKLRVGDVISLDNKSSDAIEILVEGMPTYYGKPGVMGKNMGVQILENIKMEDGKNE